MSKSNKKSKGVMSENNKNPSREKFPLSNQTSLETIEDCMNSGDRVEGVFCNPRLTAGLMSLMGTECNVHIHDGTKVNGIFEAIDGKLNMAIGAACTVNSSTFKVSCGDKNVICTAKENIAKSLEVGKDEITMTTFENVDLLFAEGKMESTKANGDGGVNTTSQHNGKDNRKVFQPWTSGDAGDDGDLVGLEDADESTGWDPEAMLKVNKDNFGVKSTYNSNLQGYTTQLVEQDTLEYAQKKQRAEKMAREIESSAGYQRNIEREVSDKATEEEKFSSVAAADGQNRGTNNKIFDRTDQGSQRGNRNRNRPAFPESKYKYSNMGSPPDGSNMHHPMASGPQHHQPKQHQMPPMDNVMQQQHHQSSHRLDALSPESNMQMKSMRGNNSQQGGRYKNQGENRNFFPDSARPGYDNMPKGPRYSGPPNNERHYRSINSRGNHNQQQQHSTYKVGGNDPAVQRQFSNEAPPPNQGSYKKLMSRNSSTSSNTAKSMLDDNTTPNAADSSGAASGQWQKEAPVMGAWQKVGSPADARTSSAGPWQEVTPAATSVVPLPSASAEVTSSNSARSKSSYNPAANRRTILERPRQRKADKSEIQPKLGSNANMRRDGGATADSKTSGAGDYNPNARPNNNAPPASFGLSLNGKPAEVKLARKKKTDVNGKAHLVEDLRTFGRNFTLSEPTKAGIEANKHNTAGKKPPATFAEVSSYGGVAPPMHNQGAPSSVNTNTKRMARVGGNQPHQVNKSYQDQAPPQLQQNQQNPRYPPDMNMMQASSAKYRMNPKTQAPHLLPILSKYTPNMPPPPPPAHIYNPNMAGQHHHPHHPPPPQARKELKVQSKPQPSINVPSTNALPMAKSSVNTFSAASAYPPPHQQQQPPVTMPARAPASAATAAPSAGSGPPPLQQQPQQINHQQQHQPPRKDEEVGSTAGNVEQAASSLNQQTSTSSKSSGGNAQETRDSTLNPDAPSFVPSLARQSNPQTPTSTPVNMVPNMQSAKPQHQPKREVHNPQQAQGAHQTVVSPSPSEQQQQQQQQQHAMHFNVGYHQNMHVLPTQPGPFRPAAPQNQQYVLPQAPVNPMPVGQHNIVAPPFHMELYHSVPRHQSNYPEALQYSYGSVLHQSQPNHAQAGAQQQSPQQTTYIQQRPPSVHNPSHIHGSLQQAPSAGGIPVGQQQPMHGNAGPQSAQGPFVTGQFYNAPTMVQHLPAGVAAANGSAALMSNNPQPLYNLPANGQFVYVNRGQHHHPMQPHNGANPQQHPHQHPHQAAGGAYIQAPLNAAPPATAVSHSGQPQPTGYMQQQPQHPQPNWNGPQNYPTSH